MATKRHKPEEIVTKLRQVEVLVGQDGLDGVKTWRGIRNGIQAHTIPEISLIYRRISGQCGGETGTK